MPTIHLSAESENHRALVVCIQVLPVALASDGMLTEAQLRQCFLFVRHKMPAFSDDFALGYHDVDCFVLEYLDERSTPVFREIFRWEALPKSLFRSVFTFDNVKINRSRPIPCKGVAILDLSGPC